MNIYKEFLKALLFNNPENKDKVDLRADYIEQIRGADKYPTCDKDVSIEERMRPYYKCMGGPENQWVYGPIAGTWENLATGQVVRYPYRPRELFIDEKYEVKNGNGKNNG